MRKSSSSSISGQFVMSSKSTEHDDKVYDVTITVCCTPPSLIRIHPSVLFRHEWRDSGVVDTQTYDDVTADDDGVCGQIEFVL